METFAYLGPEGTFTEAALQRVPEADKADHVPLGSVITALNQVRSGEVDAAVVPIENSVEGGVTATLDAIATGDELHIIREVLVPISFMLVGRPDGPSQLAELHSVSTHTHAWAQVRQWAEANIPNAASGPKPIFPTPPICKPRRRRPARTACWIRPPRMTPRCAPHIWLATWNCQSWPMVLKIPRVR